MQVKSSCRSASLILVWLLVLYSTCIVHGRSSPLDMSTVELRASYPLDKSTFEPALEEIKGEEGMELRHKLVEVKSQIGSRPPRCQSKCNTCKPCEAVQVPAVPQSRKVAAGDPIPSRGATHTQEYSNYKPMSWKCRCGDKLFNP